MQQDDTEPFALERKEKLLSDSLYDVEQWVNELVVGQLSLTPKTFLMDLPMEEGLAIVHSFQQCVLHHKNKFTLDDEKAMKNLKQRIGTLLKEHFGGGDNSTEGKRVFCRLSTRSPKDASLFEGSQSYRMTKDLIAQEWINNYYKTRNSLNTNSSGSGSSGSGRKRELKENQTPFIYSDEVEDFEGYIRNEMKYHEEYLIFMRASQQSLSVSNEEDVLDILTHSERVLRDLIKALDFPSVYNMKLIFREWCPQLSYEYEFRGFIHDFELMALTQYDNSFKVDELITKKAEISQNILNYYNNTVKPLLLSKANDPNSAISKWNGRVIMDFAILQPSNEIIIVECNPFNEGTGASLFEADRSSIVENYSKTQQQLDFRVVTNEIYGEILSHGTHVWESLFSAPREEILKEIKEKAQQPPTSTSFFNCTLL